MIIVTGGAGFIGSNLVRKLNHMGETQILIVDNLENSVKHLNLNSLLFSDIMARDDFYDNLDKIDFTHVKAIFHIGACSNTMEYNGKYMMKMNYDYSKKLLARAVNDHIKFIYASSASVYGNGDRGFIERRENEYPLNIYAYSKFIFDQYVRNILPEVKTQIVGLRYYNVYGPQENHKKNMASVIYHFHHQILNDGKIKLFEGSDGFCRDFIYVDDVVDVTLHFYQQSKSSGIFNCGTGKAESFTQIARIMNQLYANSRIEYVPFPPKLKGKYQAYTKADLSALSRIGGYQKQFTPLSEGVKKYVQVLKEHQGYYVS